MICVIDSLQSEQGLAAFNVSLYWQMLDCGKILSCKLNHSVLVSFPPNWLCRRQKLVCHTNRLPHCIVYLEFAGNTTLIIFVTRENVWTFHAFEWLCFGGPEKASKHLTKFISSLFTIKSWLGEQKTKQNKVQGFFNLAWIKYFLPKLVSRNLICSDEKLDKLCHWTAVNCFKPDPF